MTSKTNDLTQGSIQRQLFGLAVPLIATNFIQTAYNIVDMLWIGRLGSDAVVSVGTAGFFINLGISLFTVVVMGTGIKIAHSIGAKKEEQAKAYIINGYIMAIIMGLVFALLMNALRASIIGFFDLGDENIITHAESYLAISMIGMPFMFFNALYATIMNSYGRSRESFHMNATGFIINILLDPLLIFGINGHLEYGVRGAAVATVIARVMVTILAVLKHKNHLNNIGGQIRWHKDKLKEVFRLGVPTSVQRISFTVIGILMAKIIVSFGPTGIAVQKIGLQVESLSYMTIGGLHRAIAVFVGQNYGAGNYKRILSGYRNGLAFSVIFGAVMMVLFLTVPEEIFRLFVQEEETVQEGVRYLRIIGVSQVLMCVEIVTMGSFNGLGKTHISAAISMTFSALRIPIALFFGIYLGMGLVSVWWAIAGTMMARGIVSFALFIKEQKGWSY